MRRPLCSVIVLSLIAAGCGGKSTPRGAGPGASQPSSASTAGFETYTDAKYDFTIGYPKEWDKQEGAAGSAVAFLSPQESASDDFRENVNVLVQMLPDKVTLDQYTKLSLDQAPKLITGFDLLDEGSTTLAGSPAHHVHYRGEQGAFRLEWKQVWTVQNGRAFVLTYTAERERYGADLTIAGAMFATFRLP
jgi:serine/threonine-protein kinase